LNATAGLAYHRTMLRRRSPGWLAAWRRRALARMDRSRAATLRLLARIPGDAMLRPRTQGDWSIKDVLAHIAAWEEEGRRRLALIARGRGDRIVWYETMAEVDRFNARAVKAARRVSLAATLRRLARARNALASGLKRLPPRALAEPSDDGQVVAGVRERAGREALEA